MTDKWPEKIDGLTDKKVQEMVMKGTLGEVIVIIVIQGIEDDHGFPYPTTRVCRYDFEESGKNAEDFIKYVEEYHAIIEGGKMRNT